MTSIWIPGKPVTKGRPRFAGNGRWAYTPRRTVAWESAVKAAASDVWLPREPSPGPFIVRVYLYFPIPKGYSKAKKAECLDGKRVPHGDLDNYTKSILDGMNQIVWTDDTVIRELHASKWFVELADDVGAMVHVWDLSEETE